MQLVFYAPVLPYDLVEVLWIREQTGYIETLFCLHFSGLNDGSLKGVKCKRKYLTRHSARKERSHVPDHSAVELSGTEYLHSNRSERGIERLGR